ncbi:MAG TPA: cupin domain-containing protein [Anaeromyxobacteraceae bacterium]|nr:cupin domain-containing protein [Anaeromyxobacteraceae bacterium]
MAKLTIKQFGKADETRPFGHGHIDLVKFEGGTVGRGVFEPGWRWSNDVKPIAGTKSCEASHACYVLSGRMHLKMDDGTESDIEPGQFVAIPPGHDAWTIGNEACVLFDFAGATDYARPRAGAGAQPAAH